MMTEQPKLSSVQLAALLRAQLRVTALEFMCEGCGILVYAFGIERVPAHGLCEQCRWCCEELDPEAMEQFRFERGLVDPAPRPEGRRHPRG